MKAFKLSVCLGAGALALGAAALAKDDKAAAEVKSTIEKANAAWLACETDAAMKYDVEGATGYYPDSADLVVADAASRQKEVDFCTNGGKHEMTYTVNGVDVMGDVAIAHGFGHYKRTEPGGAVSVDDDYTFTNVLVKTKDGWKFKHSHVGAVMPMGESEKIVGEKS